MHLEKIQTKPSRVPVVKQTPRFVKRLDISGLANQVHPLVFFRKKIVERTFVCFHLELPDIACRSFSQNRD